MKSKFLFWLPLLLLLAICASVMVAWAFIVPVYESPDEPHHWKNAQYIHAHLALPPYTKEYLEAPQAPLYYILISPFASTMRPPPILQHPQNEKDFGFSFNNMLRVHLDSACLPHLFANCPGDMSRYWPIHEARLATSIFGVIAVLFTAFTAFEVTRRRSTALMAGALIGFLPQFDFRSASVNNDPALVCFSAITIYFIVRMVMRGFEVVPAVCGAIALALAFLSKISAAVIIPVFTLAILLTASTWRLRFQRLLYLFAICGLIAMPWLLWNKFVYGDILASSKIAQMVPDMVFRRSITDPYFRTDFARILSRSFFGYFGWLTIKMPGLIYKTYAALYLVALCGLVGTVWRRTKTLQVSVLLAATAALSLGFIVYVSMTYPQPQGRLLYQSLSAIVVLVALGLDVVPRIRTFVAAAVVFALFSIDLYALTRTVERTYWGQRPMQTSPDIQTQDASGERHHKALLEGHSYIQSFTAEHANLSDVAIEVLSNNRSSGKSNNSALRITLTSEPQSNAQPLATVSIPATAISSGSGTYLHLAFPPISNSERKKYFVNLVPTGSNGDSSYMLVVSKADTYPGGAFFVDGRDAGIDAALRTSYSRPCWSCPVDLSDIAEPVE